VPGRRLWERNLAQVTPDRSDDWLLEPQNLDKARLLFPQLDEERALLRHQQLCLGTRERDGRSFLIIQTICFCYWGVPTPISNKKADLRTGRSADSNHLDIGVIKNHRHQ
jgi:hypothetical protein